MADVYAYNWGSGGIPLSSNGVHVSSLFIAHPDFYGNLKHLEIGLVEHDGSGELPWVFRQWSNSSTKVDHPPDELYTVPNGQYHKFVIRNLTMGEPDGVAEEWVMSHNDVEWFRGLHTLTYGQALTSSEIRFVGDDNRSHFTNLKRTSKPANWTSCTASTQKFDQDDSHKFANIAGTRWYNVYDQDWDGN